MKKTTQFQPYKRGVWQPKLGKAGSCSQRAGSQARSASSWTSSTWGHSLPSSPTSAPSRRVQRTEEGPAMGVPFRLPHKHRIRWPDKVADSSQHYTQEHAESQNHFSWKRP